MFLVSNGLESATAVTTRLTNGYYGLATQLLLFYIAITTLPYYDK